MVTSSLMAESPTNRSPKTTLSVDIGILVTRVLRARKARKLLLRGVVDMQSRGDIRVLRVLITSSSALALALALASSQSTISCNIPKVRTASSTIPTRSEAVSQEAAISNRFLKSSLTSSPSLPLPKSQNRRRFERMRCALCSKLGVFKHCQNADEAANSSLRIMRPPLKSAVYITHVCASTVCCLAWIEVLISLWRALTICDFFSHVVLLGLYDLRLANSHSRSRVHGGLGTRTIWRISTILGVSAFPPVEKLHPFSLENRVDAAED
jgi:hypothetical protein